MEMEMEVLEELSASESVLERLMAATHAMEAAADRLAAMPMNAAGADLEERLAAAEATIAGLKAQGRKTVAVGSLVAKEGASFEGASIDSALGSLSVEQRIAVKAGLMRAGLV